MIFVISGAPGVGKSTVLKHLREKRKDLRFAISSTTRAPRPEETSEDYEFVTEDQFKDAIRKNLFVEYVFEGEVYYGTPKSELQERFPGEIIIADVDCKGGISIQKAFPGTITIFINAKSEIIEQRLRNRESGRMEESVINARLRRIDTEKELATKYYNIIVENDRVEGCAALIHRIIDAHTLGIPIN